MFKNLVYILFPSVSTDKPPLPREKFKKIIHLSAGRGLGRGMLKQTTRSVNPTISLKNSPSPAFLLIHIKISCTGEGAYHTKEETWRSSVLAVKALV